MFILPSALHARDENLKDFKDTHVIIVGGGYGGIGAAKKLKDQCKITLIDARDAFHHNMGAQRSSVESGTVFQSVFFAPLSEQDVSIERNEICDGIRCQIYFSYN